MLPPTQTASSLQNFCKLFQSFYSSYAAWHQRCTRSQSSATQMCLCASTGCNMHSVTARHIKHQIHSHHCEHLASWHDGRDRDAWPVVKTSGLQPSALPCSCWTIAIQRPSPTNDTTLGCKWLQLYMTTTSAVISTCVSTHAHSLCPRLPREAWLCHDP